MTAYIIADIDVTNPDGYAPYRAAAQKTIEAHGGRYIARGGAVEKLDGDWNANRVVIIEFPSMDAARKWYHCAEYQDALKIRLAHSKGRAILTEGLPA
jgi:uncharacterized protein (DUF1330 family)